GRDLHAVDERVRRELALLQATVLVEEVEVALARVALDRARARRELEALERAALVERHPVAGADVDARIDVARRGHLAAAEPSARVEREAVLTGPPLEQARVREAAALQPAAREDLDRLPLGAGETVDRELLGE